MGNCLGCYRFKDEDIEDLFIEYYLVHGKIPPQNELAKHGLPSHRTIKRRFGITVNEYLERIGIPINKKTVKRKSREEMIQDLLKLHSELKRTPRATDLNGRKDMCGKNAYSLEFGSWNNALKEAGIPHNWRRVTDEEIISVLVDFYKKNGRSPTTRDKLEVGWSTIANRFGTWNKALEAAGLPCNENIYSYKTKGLDGIEYDSVSEAMVADWLYKNNIKYESHVPYFRSLIADFKVGEYYIEFFGLKSEEYMNKVKLKKRLCEKNGYKLIEIYPEDLRNLDEKLGFLRERSDRH
jgi:hypothetical protein